jgi:(hydroxyamino)benzene mutase
MGDYLTDPAFREDPQRYASTETLLELIASRPVAFEPGSDSRYSNSGFVLLGAILEALEGSSCHEVMDAWIFTPLGMSDTGPEGTAALGNTAFGYSAGPQGTGPMRRFPAAPATAAGGAYSTASDLHRFVLALLRDALLDPVHTDLCLNMHVPGPDPSIRETTGYARAGGAPGASAVTIGDPTTLDVVVVLSNRSSAPTTHAFPPDPCHRRSMDRTLIQLGFLLVLLALLTGFAIPSFASPRLGLAAHTVGIVGGLTLIVVGAIAASIRLGSRLSAVFVWSWVYATCANWIGCLLAALTGASRLTPIAGAGTSGTPVSEGIVAFVFLSEAVAALLGVGLALWGLRAGSQSAAKDPLQPGVIRTRIPAEG